MKQLYACMAGVALGLAPHLLPAASDGGVAVRAYVNDSCIVADEPFFMPESLVNGEQKARMLPLLGIVVGKVAELLIKYVVGHATDRIRTAGGRKDTYYGTTREMNLFRADLDPAPVVRLNSKLGCMTVVAARNFLPDDTNCNSTYIPKEIARETMALPESEWTTTRSDESVENTLRRANICVDGMANAVYEARFEFSEDGTAYRLRDAGYRINSLLTVPSKATTRSVFYTIEIATPGPKNDQQDVLSTAWVNIGMVNAGARRDAPAADSQAWLRVPPMTADARRAYEEETRVHHELAAEAAAAKRSLSRNQRVVDELGRRIAAAGNTAMAAALGQEKMKVEVQNQVLEAELQASNAEYAALPHKSPEFMPVSIKVGITESRSEKAALLALATVVDHAGDSVAAFGGELSAGLVNNRRSVDPVLGPAAGATAKAPAATDPGAQLETARAAYYDQLVEYKAAAAGGSALPADQLADAKLHYNVARRAVGLDAMP